MSSMVTLAAAAARPALACTVTLQLSPGTDPSQGEHCSHNLKVDAFEKKSRAAKLEGKKKTASIGKESSIEIK